MAAGRDGTVYIVQSGDIRRYEGPTGRALGEVSGGRYESVFVALDGTLWTIADRTRVVQLSAEGRELRSFDVADGAGTGAHPNDVAVSGAGDVYVSDQFSGEIYRFDSAGRFQDRFGGRGEGAGNVRMPSGLAVDGRGRLYVSDPGNGIRVFDASGQFINSFAGGQVVFGLAFTDDDELYAAHRNDHAVVVWRVAE
jgi:sugar lactone lactonase YvrE